MGKPATKNRATRRSKTRGKTTAAGARPDTSQATRRKAGSYGNSHLSQVRELTVYECWLACSPDVSFSVWAKRLRAYAPPHSAREYGNLLVRYGAGAHRRVFSAAGLMRP